MRLPFCKRGALARAFRFRGAVSKPVIVVFLGIHAVVFANAFLHDPSIGYDAHHHLKYAWALGQGRLPERADSNVFFSPPLPYAAPAVAHAITGDPVLAGKIGQVANGFVSLLLAFYLVRTCKLISPRPALAVSALLLLGMLPVYYKTFAFVRGESYAACFTVIACYFAILVFVRGLATTRHAVLLGIALGLGALSRQWGVLLFPAVAAVGACAWLRQPVRRRALALCLCLALGLGGVLGGWFYMVLKVREGSATAFNRVRAESFSLSNHPRSFYTGIPLRPLFTGPLRPAFEHQFWPQFYAETWGDYRCYFCVYGVNTEKRVFVTGLWLWKAWKEKRAWLETNYGSMRAYLGRVNAVSLFPSLLLLAGLARAVLSAAGVVRDGRRMRGAILFLLLALGATLAGYGWYVVMHPAKPAHGLSIRATHVLQIFPLLAVLGGVLLERIERNRPRLYAVLMAVLLAVCAHNLPAMVTRYAPFVLK